MHLLKWHYKEIFGGKISDSKDLEFNLYKNNYNNLILILSDMLYLFPIDNFLFIL